MPVVLNLDGKHPKCQIPNDTWRISLDSDDREQVDGYWNLSYAAGPLDWSQLSRLKELKDVTYSGRDASVLDYLASPKCTVSTFSWHESGRSRFDFSNAKALDNIGIEVTGKSLHIKLPTHGRFDYLRILHPPEGCRATVVCPNRGEGVTLMIYGPTFLAIPGLKQIRRLQLFDCRDVDLSGIAKAYPHLESLDISGKAVALRQEGALAKLKFLEELRIHECYTMSVAAFPDPAEIPALESLEVDGVRAADAEALKAKYQSLEELSLRGKRTPEWIANNLENPFRDWSDFFGSATGKKAMSAWNTANNALGKLGKKANAKNSATILKAFVDTFNQLEEKSGLETDQRETIYDAFMALTEELPKGMVTEDHYYEWAEFA